MPSANDDGEPLVIEQILAPRQGSGFTANAAEDKGHELKVLCCDDIDIPSELPIILKNYTKGAITTQPRNLLHWSAAYFRSMCKGEVPPVKDRLEVPAQEGPNGLTKGLLRILQKQLGGQAQGDSGALKEKWTDICLKADDMTKLLQDNDLPEVGFNWMQFVAVAAASIQLGGIRETMEIICFAMADDVSHGVTITMGVEKFTKMYAFIAPKYGVAKETVETVTKFLITRAASQGNRIGPKDFNDPECPPLEETV